MSTQEARNLIGKDTLLNNSNLLALVNGSETSLHSHAAGGGADEKVKVDAAATAGYLGANSNDGVLRIGAGITYADGGNFITLTASGGGGDPEGDVPVTVDSESNTLIIDHAYKAQTAGFVTAWVQGIIRMRGYVGTTTNPAGAGQMVGYTMEYHSASANRTMGFFVAKDKYFEVDSTGTPTITWSPLITGGGAPIDQD